MAKISELPGILSALVVGVDKIIEEVQALKDGLGDTEIPAEAQTHLDNLTARLQALDDLNPDATPEPPPEQPA